MITLAVFFVNRPPAPVLSYSVSELFSNTSMWSLFCIFYRCLNQCIVESKIAKTFVDKEIEAFRDRLGKQLRNRKGGQELHSAFSQ
jgi:hypothetical protein